MILISPLACTCTGNSSNKDEKLRWAYDTLSKRQLKL